MIPLFPLTTVLFPGGLLPLQIFEPRYLDMVSECLRLEEGFGISLIQSGSETGTAAECFAVGTYARIVDWQQLSNGLLGIIVLGEKRYRLIDTSVGSNQLVRGEVEWLAEPPGDDGIDLRASGYAWLRQLINRLELAEEEMEEALADTALLGFRLAEYLSLPPMLKQQLLEIDESRRRLEKLHEFLDRPRIVH